MVMATPSEAPQILSPISLEPPAASRIVFEPRIDVVPAPPNLLPRWYVWRDPLDFLGSEASHEALLCGESADSRSQEVITSGAT